jgi:hypothetical protein
MLEGRKVVRTACTVAAVTALVIAAPASSLNLPAVTVTAPTVTVKTPTVAVTTPPVTVTTPSVPIQTPTIPIKTPTVPVKVPSVPIKTPTIPIQTPSPSTSISAKTPTVSAKTPTVGTSAPSVSVKGPSVATGTSTTSSGRTASGAQPSSTGKAAAGQGSTSGTSTASGGEARGAAPARLGAYGSTDGGYGQLPVFEGRPGRNARARIASRERMLKAKVARFQGCLGTLPATQRELLELRTGLGASRPLGPRAAASRLHLGSARFARLEKQAVRELSDAASTHGCSQMSEVVARVAAFIGAGFGGGQIGATGGVKAVSYSAPAPKPAGARSSTIGGLLGANISTVASDVILGLLLLMAGGLAVAVVAADAAGQGPRHEQWRQRVVNRIRWMR